MRSMRLVMAVSVLALAVASGCGSSSRTQVPYGGASGYGGSAGSNVTRIYYPVAMPGQSPRQSPAPGGGGDPRTGAGLGTQLGAGAAGLGEAAPRSKDGAPLADTPLRAERPVPESPGPGAEEPL